MIEEVRLDNKSKSGFLPFVVILLIFVVLFNVLNNYIMVVQVDGASMNNTLKHGDVLIVDRSFDIERGDVIIFDRPNGKLIKRVIAVQGDELYSENGEVYLKKVGETEFTKLEEEYAKGITTSLTHTIVEENKLFVLGDNRENSKDSRVFGTIELTSVSGEVSNSSIKNKNISTFFICWVFKISEFFGRV